MEELVRRLKFFKCSGQVGQEDQDDQEVPVKDGGDAKDAHDGPSTGPRQLTRSSKRRKRKLKLKSRPA